MDYKQKINESLELLIKEELENKLSLTTILNNLIKQQLISDQQTNNNINYLQLDSNYLLNNELGLLPINFTLDDNDIKIYQSSIQFIDKEDKFLNNPSKILDWSNIYKCIKQDMLKELENKPEYQKQFDDSFIYDLLEQI